jgi:UDP-N-acetylmuramyl pentapeptide synthase
LKLAGSKPGKVLVLNDLREAGSASAGARKIYTQLMKNEKFEKGAFVGMKVLTRVIVSFITKFSGVNNVKYFETEEEAIKWLKE